MNSFMQLMCVGEYFPCMNTYQETKVVSPNKHSTKMDPFNNCVHLACTEIRAENLSGECNTIREMMQGRITTFAGHGQECVKRRAALSLQANPKCRDGANEFVDAAMERCYSDTYPFERHPSQA